MRLEGPPTGELPERRGRGRGEAAGEEKDLGLALAAAKSPERRDPSPYRAGSGLLCLFGFFLSPPLTCYHARESFLLLCSRARGFFPPEPLFPLPEASDFA